MNTIVCRIKTAARILMLLIFVANSIDGFAQFVFETKEDVQQGPDYLRNIMINQGDLDGDGDLDLLITGTRDIGTGSKEFGIAELYFNNGNAGFSLVSDNFENLEKAALADIDGDQDLDVLLFSQHSLIYKSELYLNDGKGNFTMASKSPFPQFNRGRVAFFHYDDDELLDFIIAAQMPGNIRITSIYRNLGNGEFEEVSGIGLDIKYKASNLEIIDIDKDGVDDIILLGDMQNGSGGVYIFKSSSGIFSQSLLKKLSNGDIKLGDFDSDGAPELILLGNDSSGNHFAEYYRNDGSGNFTLATDQPFDSAFVPEIETADFDGDGDLDVFIGGRDFVSDNGNVLYRNDGHGNFEKAQKLGVLFGGGTAVGNFDGQGLEDIIIFGKMDNLQGLVKNMVFLNQGKIDKIPVVTEVRISGELSMGSELEGSYNFQDPEEAEDQSNLRWYRALDNSGKEKMLIEGATSSTYTASEADVDKYIGFQVVPFDGKQTGEAVLSQWLGPIVKPLPELVVKGNNIILKPGTSTSMEDHTDFGGVKRNNEIKRTFSIENVGTGELLLSSFTVSGTNAADFTIMDSSISTVSPGASVALEIDFKPSGLGIRTAEIKIENNDEENNPFTFQISGEGLNSPPVFNTPSEVTHAENNPGIIMDINADNGEGGANDFEIVYSITEGEDKDFFIIDQENGQMSFSFIPDFENPLDLDKDNVYHVTVAANDQQGQNNLSTQQITVSVSNIDELPTANCITNVTVILDANGSAVLSVEDINNNSTDDIEIAEISIVPSQFSCTDLGLQNVVLTVKDSGGNTATCMTQVTVVDDQKPEIQEVMPIAVETGAGGCGAYLAITPPEVKDNCSGTLITGSRSDGLKLDEMFPIGETEIIWTATDKNNISSNPKTQLITVSNKAPNEISFIAPDGPREIGTPIPMKGKFSDDNIKSVTWKAYNGNTVVQEYSAAATGSETTHTFENLPAGVYTIILELTDHCGMTATGYSEYVVLYDPNGGFVTGGGWFNSPEGALIGSDAVGKAHFGFNAKYKTGKNDIGEVGGNTSFQFKTGNIDFQSDSHEKMSLVVSGGFKATYKGIGKVNGMGEYKFMVTVIDAEETTYHTVDLFRIKIWNSQGVLYDNMLNAEENADPTTYIGGGSIVIHKPKSGSLSKTPETVEEKELAEGLEVFTAYPNPMDISTTIKFRLNRSAGAILNLYDLNGREISKLYKGQVEPGVEYEVEIKNNNLMKGVYIYRLELDSGEAYQKQLLVN